MGASRTFLGHLARFGTVRGDLSGTRARRPHAFLAKNFMVGAWVE